MSATNPRAESELLSHVVEVPSPQPGWRRFELTGREIRLLTKARATAAGWWRVTLLIRDPLAGDQVLEIEVDSNGEVRLGTGDLLSHAEGGDLHLPIDEDLEVRHPVEGLAEDRLPRPPDTDSARRPRPSTSARADAGDLASSVEVDGDVRSDTDRLRPTIGRLTGSTGVAHETSSAGTGDRPGAPTPSDCPQAATLQNSNDTPDGAGPRGHIGTTLHHVHLSVPGAVANWTDKEWRRNAKNMTRGDGSKHDAESLKSAMVDLLLEGVQALPIGEPCEGFDYKTGCPGHAGGGS